jgi:hypothetical protein
MEKWQNLYCSGFLYFIFNSNKKLECFEIDVFLGAEKKKRRREREKEGRWLRNGTTIFLFLPTETITIQLQLDCN